MIALSAIAVLLIILASCVTFVAVYWLVYAYESLTRWYRYRRVLPPPTTLACRNVTSILRWRALRGSGADRFRLSAYKEE